MLDNGINPHDIVWIDPDFLVGDFGKKWRFVSSNTTVKNLKDYLTAIKSFDYDHKSTRYDIKSMDEKGFTPLKDVAIPLQYITDKLMSSVVTIKDEIISQNCSNAAWQLTGKKNNLSAKKVILATGSYANSMNINNLTEIDLATALTPHMLKSNISDDDNVAVFGSSHSAIAIIKNLLDCGVKNVINLYRSPLKYALRMQGWTLYDNTGLKGNTAIWARENISQNLDSRITRHILANDDELSQKLRSCNKVVYATGFTQRAPQVYGVNTQRYDSSNGIIAPGLFGVGIGFPKKVSDPNGNIELNVGLHKFMLDLKISLPIWMQYGL